MAVLQSKCSISECSEGPKPQFRAFRARWAQELGTMPPTRFISVDLGIPLQTEHWVHSERLLTDTKLVPRYRAVYTTYLNGAIFSLLHLFGAQLFHSASKPQAKLNSTYSRWLSHHHIP